MMANASKDTPPPPRSPRAPSPSPSTSSSSSSSGVSSPPPTSSAGVRHAPGPRGVPLLGNTLDAWRDPIELFLRARREHGDVVSFQFGPFRYYLLNDADAVKHVLVDNHRAYTKSRNYQGLKLVLGEGLLTSEGEFWRRQRRLAQPAFHLKHMAGFAREMVACTSAMLARWRKEHAPGAVIDAHAEMMRLTFQIVGRTLLSADVDDPAGEIGRAIAEGIEFANDYAEALVRVPPWVPTPRNKRFQRALATIDRVVLGVIDARRKSGEQHDDLLDMLMRVEDADTHETMSDRQLRDEVITLVLAGHETTANALAWTIYLLSRHPDVLRKVEAELAQVLGGRAPAFDDLPRLAYTSMVLSESLRLYPPAWAFERQAVERDVVGGYTIEPGTIVGVAPYALHRNPRYWDNPEGFDPERFSPARAEGRPRYAYLPFGGGPRTCIGNHFALMEAQLVLAMLVQSYRLELVPGCAVEPSPTVTLRPRHGVMVTAHPR